MSDALTFSVPWAALCSDNRKFVSGSFILTKEYRASKELIGQLALAAARKHKWVRQEGPLAFECVVREPDRRRRDLNWSKNCRDGITQGEGVWWDDSQVRWELWRFDESGPPDKATAGATITIRVLDNFRETPNTGPYDAAQAPARPPMGHPGDVRGAVTPGLQRPRRVRGRAATPTEPAGPTPKRTGRGRRTGGPASERSTGRAVSGGEGSAAAETGPVRPPAQAPRPSRRHERPQ